MPTASGKSILANHGLSLLATCLLEFSAQKLTGAIIPALMHRIPSELRKANGCDHTSTNAPDPIRTPQLSVLGREYAQKLTGAIIPALMHRIPSELRKANGCDHTSTNAPDPIRTPQLSVLGRE
ncbi:hypothetical protein RJ640_010557 [Escallonia rubra]|uniref:Uncharacterized protein n=1 Tax=Escallonia rubra TaxID=112253 RepID=A0AA88UU99_9ASTE|nr:hypothetical protein RJ640_010557 [Escallonia rubra]